MWSGEEITENEEVWSLADSEELDKERHQEKSDWADDLLTARLSSSTLSLTLWMDSKGSETA